MAKDFWAELSTFISREVKGTLFTAAGDRRREIQQRLEAESKQFFRMVASEMGTDRTPDKVTMYDREYPELSDDWKRKKFRPRGMRKGKHTDNRATVGRNAFHVGRGRGTRLRTVLARKDATQMYGKPRVVFKGATGNSGEYQQEAGGTRIRHIKTGRFASPRNVVFKATLEVDMFPKVKSKKNLLNRFAGKTRKKLAYIEFGVPSRNRPARPLLAPMMEWYTDTHVNELLKRVVG